MSDKILFGAAYYAEYMPEERIEKDLDLMKAAGFNLIRVAESTWSTWEPSDGVFDFSILHRVLGAAQDRGISVIVGTPTYAIPPWLYKKYPDILSDTHGGPCRYGHRQNMDITHPGFRSHAERIIRRLMEEVRGYDCVVGFQLDNETKHYDTCSERAQAMFKAWLMERFGTVEALNRELGLAYWSNSLGSWDDLPDVRGTINGSLGAEYQAFQRRLVTDYLRWQRSIVDEYRRPEQFVTHNFDYEWRNYSFGYQPEVDQFEAAKALTVIGCDIYHPSESALTGAEISFCGAVARGLKKDNYLVLETQAQGNLGWLPYPGQLRLQAFSHLASGAGGIEYWNWHSIHNAIESYWMGVLSHDLSPGEIYREAASIGADLERTGGLLLGLKKSCKTAVMVSNRSLMGLEWFPCCAAGEKPEKNYNDFLRWICDSLYRLNVEYDVISDSERDFSRYELLILPCLYSAPEELLCAVDRYVSSGGHIIASFRSGFADEHLKIYHDTQPHILNRCLGLSYDRFTRPEHAELSSELVRVPEGIKLTDWMELIELHGATALCTCRHMAWGSVPVVTENAYGLGKAAYISACFDSEGLDAVLRVLLPRLAVPLSGPEFPLIVKNGVNKYGKSIMYLLNYSAAPVNTAAPCRALSLLDGEELESGQAVELPPWGVKILEM